MSYASQDDLIKKFGETALIQRTDRTNSPPSAIDTAVVNQALADADAVIDSFLAARYVLPLASIPAVLTAIARDLAAYNLFSDSMGEAVRKDRDDAMKLLRDLSDGRAKLDLPGTVEAPLSGGVQTISNGRVFSGTTLGDY